MTVSEFSLLLAKIMSAWYEGKNKNTEGNGASDKSSDGREKNSCVYDCLWASSGRYTAENFNAECFGLTLRRLMSYIYGAPILDVSRSHTTTQHSR